jgi:hypothetical protein
MAPLVGFHDRGPDDDDKSDKRQRFNDDRPQWSKKSGLRREAKRLSGDATFLQRLLVGWTRSNGVKLVSFGEGNRQMFVVKRCERGSMSVV